MRWPWRRDEVVVTDAAVGERAEWVAVRSSSLSFRRTVMASGTARLDEPDVVRAWLRGMQPDREESVLVHRSWGTVVAIADDRRPASVLLSHGEQGWYAVPLGPVPDDEPLTPTQVEQVMLEALTAQERATWLRWVPIL